MSHSVIYIYMTILFMQRYCWNI